MSSLIQIRRDISTNWSSVNPILSHGELGFDVTLNRLKVGNGTTPWNTLAWLDFDITQSLNLLDLGIPDGTNGQVLSTNGSASFQFIDLPKDLADLTDTTGLLTNPVNTSDLVNDSGFITIAAVPTKVSQLTNDTGFLTAAALPSNVSALTNDVGYITSAALPTDISQLTDTTSLLSVPAGGNGTIQISSAGEFAAAAGANYNNATSTMSLTKLEVDAVVGHLLPETHLQQDLGSPTQRWRDIYLSTNTIHLGDDSIGVDADGDLTFNSVKLIDKTAMEALIGDAPQLLDTLKELSDAIGGDANFIQTMVAADTALQNAIAAETAAREAAIADVVASSGAAGASLQTTVDSISTALSNEIATRSLNEQKETDFRQAADTLLQANIDQLQSSLAPVALSGSYADLTGTPTGMATEVYVDAAVATAVSDLVNAAPATLDSLNELATALGQDPNFATTVATQFGILQDADAALQASIDAVTSSSGDATAALQTALASETADRIAGDDALQTALTTEVDARTAADTALQTSITTLSSELANQIITSSNAIAAEADMRASADGTIQSNIDALQSSLATVATTGAYADLIGIPTGMATEVYVDAAIASLVASSPDALNTLNELATALGNDADFATSVTTQIATKADAATTYTKTEVDAAIADVGSSLATVATSGSYDDLIDKPDLSIYALGSDVTGLSLQVSSLAGSAFSGDYVDLTNKPTLFSGSYNDLTDLPTATPASTTVAATAPTGNTGDLWFNTSDGRMYVYDGSIWIDSSPIAPAEVYTLSNLLDVDATTPGAGDVLTFDGSVWVAGTPAGQFSGDYNDLTNKPTIPSITGLATESYVDTAVANVINSAPGALDTLNELAAALGNDANFATTITSQLTTLSGQVSTLSGSAFSGSYNDLTDKPVLFSGAYADLTGTPDLSGYALATDVSGLTLTDLDITDGTAGQVLSSNGDGTFSFIAAPTGGGGGASVVVSATAPSTPSTGDLWYDETEARTFIWNGSAWVDSSPAASSGIDITTLKTIVAASADFADFQSRIAAL